MMDRDKYIFTLEMAVRDYELDSEGIVNNAIYLHYMEHTRHTFVKQEGVPFGSMTSDGLVPVVRRMEIDYHVPLRTGDVMLSCLWIERKGARFIFYQHIFRKDDEALVAETGGFFTMPESYEGVCRLLEGGAEFTALFSLSDTTAIAAIKALENKRETFNRIMGETPESLSFNHEQGTLADVAALVSAQ